MSKLVGIIYSPGFGAGWSTWGDDEQAFDQELAQAISDGRPYPEIADIADKHWPDAYKGGLADCVVKWVEKGTEFFIDEYDGSEAITFRDDCEIWQKA